MNERPTIFVEPGRLPYLADAAERVLLEDYRRWSLFQRAGMMVRVVSPDREDDRVRRPQGAMILRTATVPMLADILNQAIRWRVGTPPKDRDIDCPAKIPSTILSRSGLWRLHELVGTVSAPVMRDDGSILLKPGFDEATGLLLVSSAMWSAPPSLSREAVAAAVKCLCAPFAEFPLSRAGLSVVISGILTGIQRRKLYSAPAHGIDAPVQGSGKTLIGDVIAIIVTGNPAASMSANGDMDELQKKLVSVLIAGDAIVSLDNVTKPLRSDALATILTVSEYRDRILGASQIVAVPTNVLFLVTGNNLQFSDDMPSRVLSARLEPEVERPEERTFNISDLRTHVLEHRAELVRAALTILQAYFIAGRPSQNVKPFGRFEQWSKEIREAIVWAGLADPCETRESVIAVDPERDAALVIFATWHRAFGKGAITIQTLIQEAAGDTDLKTALLEVAADLKNTHEINSRRLAAWCRARAGRVVADFKLSRAGAAHAGFAAWQVVRVSEANSQVSETKEVPREL